MIDTGQLDFLETIESPPWALLSPSEIYERCDADLLYQLREDRRVERKPARFGDAQVAEYISMWANTSPDGGVIVVGMRDRGLFEGLNGVGAEKLNKLEKAGARLCPDAAYQSKRVAVTNQQGKKDFVLVIRVQYHQSRVVKTNKGDAFIRQGDEKHRLTAEEVRELQNDKKEVRFEEEICALDFPADFNRAAIHEFADRVRNERGLDEDSHTDEAILCIMHLGKMVSGEFRPNVACALLFAFDPAVVAPGSAIRFLRFDGEVEGTGDKWNAVKDETIEGSIAAIITKAGQTIHSQMRTFSRLGPNGKFYTQPEYPPVAWWEAVVNACVHRSYGDGLKTTPVSVKMFDDRLVIESPGPFPPFVTPVNIYDSHIPRNPFLMTALRYMDYVKCAHEGTRRMKASMSEMELPDPEFKQDQVGFAMVRVTLRNNVNQRKAWVDRDVAEMVGTLVAKQLTPNERRFLNFIAEHGAISVSDAQRLSNLSWHTARKVLMRLVDRGILRRDGRKNVDRDSLARFRLNK